MAAQTDFADPVITPLDHFAGARDAAGPGERLRRVRDRARRLREDMLAGPKVRLLRSFPLVRVPYPAKYGFLNALSVPATFIHIVNRLFVVQVDTPVGVKTILVSPSDLDGNAETPFFKRLAESIPLRGLTERFLAPRIATVEECLAQCGIRPEQVDYITYDHLHTQELRKWLGSHGSPPVFPNAKLLVMRQEWESARDLLPPQRDWYCPGGTDGIDPDRVVLLDGSVMIGDGLALVATPGHTEGNHSVVTHTAEGLFVTSENGVGPDAYAPLASRVPGLRKYARQTGMEVVLNGNTLEGGLDQYVSMVMEKTIAGPSERNPDFPNMLCSSEFDAFWGSPGVRPTFGFGDVHFGEVSRG